MADRDVIELPLHLKWSGPRRYDLGDPLQLRRVYEIVLREGGELDIRRYLDPDLVLELLPDLVLPDRIRNAWRDWAAETGRGPRC